MFAKSEYGLFSLFTKLISLPYSLYINTPAKLIYDGSGKYITILLTPYTDLYVGISSNKLLLLE